MSNKKWEAIPTQVTGGYVVRPVGWERGVATVTQRDPHPIHGQGITWDEALVNAQLIAAAPELLSALTLILNLNDHDVWIDESWKVALDNARAALSKARGEV